ncbi:hypothetical protein BGZ58_004037 [Dissophora ornata]|nr:hypothetical protein BGZ58_004037 [Dissophora ornata]
MDKVGEYEGEGEGEDVDNDEDDEEDCGRNCLANQLLVVTKVQLEPSDDIDDLTDHCLLSFSYPADLAEQCIDRTNPTPESPVASTPDYDDEDEDEDQEFVDASDVEYCESDQECNAAFLATLAMTTEDIHVYDDFVPECKPVAMMANNLDPSASYLKPQPQANGELRIKTSTPYDRLQDDITPTNASSPSIQRRQEDLPLHHLSGSDCYNKKGRPLPPPVPPRNPDLHAAGRSFLHQLHTRFQKQTVWKAWEVGQQKVILPVVAM